MTSSTTDTDTAGDIDNPSEEAAAELKLQIQIDQPSSCQRHVTVTIGPEDVQRYFDDVFSEMMATANVPGFRPGRAPRKLVESHYRKDVADKVKGNLLVDAMAQVTDGDQFSPIGEPEFDFDAVEVPDDGPLTFEFDIEVRPEFDMPQWRGLKLEKPTRDFGKKDIDEHLEKLLERHAEHVTVEGKAEAGDFAKMDLMFSHEGKQISTVESVSARIRPTLSLADGNLDGFDKLMVGATAGSTHQTKMKLTAEAENQDLRGEEIDVELKVLEISRLKLPEIDDKLLVAMGSFENEGDLRDAIKSELERQLGYYHNRRVREQICELLTESADWELPPALLRRQSHRELERAVMELRASGFSDEQIAAQENYLRQHSESSTAKALKEHFTLERIAEEEELEATDDDYDSEIMLMAAQSDESPRSVRARIEKRGLMDVLRNQIVERKAIDRVKDEAKFKEVKYQSPKDNVAPVDFAIAGVRANIPEAKHDGDATDLTQPVDRT